MQKNNLSYMMSIGFTLIKYKDTQKKCVKYLFYAFQ